MIQLVDFRDRWDGLFKSGHGMRVLWGVCEHGNDMCLMYVESINDGYGPSGVSSLLHERYE